MCKLVFPLHSVSGWMFRLNLSAEWSGDRNQGNGPGKTISVLHKNKCIAFLFPTNFGLKYDNSWSENYSIFNLTMYPHTCNIVLCTVYSVYVSVFNAKSRKIKIRAHCSELCTLMRLSALGCEKRRRKRLSCSVCRLFIDSFGIFLHNPRDRRLWSWQSLTIIPAYHSHIGRR